MSFSTKFVKEAAFWTRPTSRKKFHDTRLFCYLLLKTLLSGTN